jgi:hypothetical protein
MNYYNAIIPHVAKEVIEAYLDYEQYRAYVG